MKKWQKEKDKADDSPMKPSSQLLCKLGSIIVHAEEALDKDGHEFDITAMKSLLKDSDVKDWLKRMDEMALIPKKRK